MSVTNIANIMTVHALAWHFDVTDKLVIFLSRFKGALNNLTYSRMEIIFAFNSVFTQMLGPSFTP